MAREEPHVVRMSARPPIKFSSASDFSLWIRRFEIYLTEAGIPSDKRAKELLSLLEDEPFRVVSQLGLADGDDYGALKKQLQQHYAPDGNELEWQFKLQNRQQKPGEALADFAGELRVMVDKAYPTWSAKSRLEMARNQFIQGLDSASIQLLLMRERPKTLDAALELAQQQLAVETAQKRLQRRVTPLHLCHAESEPEGHPEANAVRSSSSTGGKSQVEELSKQVLRLSDELARLRADYERFPRQQRSRRAIVCWNCGIRGHVKRVCPKLERGERQRGAPRCQPPLN